MPTDPHLFKCKDSKGKLIKNKHCYKVTDLLKTKKNKYSFINNKKVQSISNEELLNIQDENLKEIEKETKNHKFWDSLVFMRGE